MGFFFLGQKCFLVGGYPQILAIGLQIGSFFSN